MYLSTRFYFTNKPFDTATDSQILIPVLIVRQGKVNTPQYSRAQRRRLALDWIRSICVFIKLDTFSSLVQTNCISQQNKCVRLCSNSILSYIRNENLKQKTGQAACPTAISLEKISLLISYFDPSQYTLRTKPEISLLHSFASHKFFYLA